MTDKTPLQVAREARRLTREALAEATGVSTSHLVKLERRERKMTVDWARRFAPHVGVTPQSLLEIPDDASIAAAGPAPASEGQALTILEYDVGASAGGGSTPPHLNGDHSPPVLAAWSMPTDMIRAHTTPGARLAVVRVEGDSMEPDYLSGDRVLVDLSRTVPTPPGVFVLWDGMGLVLKRVELVIGGPKRVRLSSVNAAYLPYEVPLDDLHISGRVIGKWMWR